MAIRRKKPDWRKLVDKHKIVAIIRAEDEERALGAAQAAIKGGLKIIEITLNTPGALRAIKALSLLDNIFLGAGTVRSVKMAKGALKAGAQFIVSPHFDRRIVSFVTRRGLLAIPGCATPSEMLAARERGAGLIKVFPADLLGGVDFVKAVLAPLPDLPLMPTGGVNPKNIKDYLQAGATAVAVGGTLFKKELLLSKNYKGITAAAEHLVEIVSK